MKTTGLLLALLFSIAAAAQSQQEPEQPKPLKAVAVNIEASEYDRRLLLEKLTEHGRSEGMRFEQADKNFAYRIVFKVEQDTKVEVNAGTGGTRNVSSAIASVFDPKGVELFSLKRAGRHTDGGATNAAAKEIIKRMVKLQSPAAS